MERPWYWLGTGNIANFLRVYRPFAQARAFARSLKLQSQTEWNAFTQGKLPTKGKLPIDIPAGPNSTYANKGWKGMGDWLGTGTIAPRLREYRSFTKARAFVRGLKLKSRTQWEDFCKGKLPATGRLPDDIPAVPRQMYVDKGWVDWGDWLGTGRVANQCRKFRPFPEARAFVRGLKLKSRTQWENFCKGKLPATGRLPNDIPAIPPQTYVDKGWVGWGDWLGTGMIAPQLREYRSFNKARAFARSLNLKSETEWRVFCKDKIPAKGKLPADIPARPGLVYADKGWKGMGDWLGTGNIANFNKRFRPFAKARAFAHSLKLKSQTEWYAFCNGKMPSKGMRPLDIPANPFKTYADKGWKGYGDWLGTGRTRKPSARQHQ